jgi:hypothetical protein
LPEQRHHSTGTTLCLIFKKSLFKNTLDLNSRKNPVNCYIWSIIEIGGCYGMEMNVEKTKVTRISRKPFPVKIMLDQKN